MSFGGKNWTIDPADFQLSKLSTTNCLGAFFELATASSAPSWIVGDTFLVRLIPPPPSIIKTITTKLIEFYLFFFCRKMFTPSFAMTHFLLDLLNSPMRLWLRMIRVLKLLHLPSVLQQQLFLQLPLGAVRQNLNQLLAVWTIIIIVIILLQPMLLFLLPHFVLQVLLPLDICFKISLSYPTRY